MCFPKKFQLLLVNRLEIGLWAGLYLLIFCPEMGKSTPPPSEDILGNPTPLSPKKSLDI